MTILHSIILGLVEGVTEFLPVSSTGHLILVSELLKIGQSDFVKSFEIIIQLGAILAVVVLYWKRLWNIENIKKLIVGFIPTGVIGLVLYKVVKTYLLGNDRVVLWALLLGGIALVAFEYWYRSRPLAVPQGVAENGEGIGAITYKQSFWIGLCQSLAIIPGVSRSAASIVGGLLAGVPRPAIVEFSFLLAVPTMLAATGLDLVKNASSFSSDQTSVLVVGFVVSFVVAWGSIKFLIRYVREHTFVPFGVYRIVLALLFLAFF